MKLRAESGNEFELLIVRYQHPDVHEDRWDSNWLIVNGHVSTPGETWRFTEPCVTTFELADFADWLESLGRGTRRNGDFCFTEPNLRFTHTTAPEPVLRVTFARQSAPPSVVSDQEREAGVAVDFPLAGIDTTAVAGEIRDALEDYPIRGGAA